MPASRLLSVIPSYVWLVVLLIACTQILPLRLLPFGGDYLFQYVAIECFASQFWAGDWYPRWCFKGNAGLGAPLFVYYFPLPFYVASLLYPLTWLGVSLESLYLLLLWLTTLVTGLTAWFWLRDITSEQKALLVAAIYMFFPYRMELMMFRSAYAELLCLAFVPLVCKYARQLAQGQPYALVWLALSLALCFLSNMPAAVIVGMAVGLYVAFAGRGHVWTNSIRYGLALGWASLMAAFYVGPAILYKPFISGEGVTGGERSWCNDFLTIGNITERGQGQLVIAITLMLVASMGLCLFAQIKRKKIADVFMRQDLFIWSVLAFLSALLMFKPSQLIWDQMGFVAALAYPWRMQLVVMMAVIMVMAIMVQWLLPEDIKQVRKGDVIVPFGLLVLLGLFVISARPPDADEYADKVVDARFMTQREYRSIWTDKPYIDRDQILTRYDQRKMRPRTKRIDGDASVTVTSWDMDAVIMQVTAQTASTVLLDLQYFPIWQLESDMAVQMEAEKGWGRMLLTLPQGSYQVKLTASIYTLAPILIMLCMVASILAWLALIAVIVQRKRQRKAVT